MGLIRSFMGEAVETNRQLLDAETSTVFVDESTRYQEESSFQRSVSAVGDKLPISGMTQAYEWETLHPANNAPVVGVVMQWKVDSAKIAGFLSSLNLASGEKAKAAAAGAYGAGATANSNAPKNAPAPQKKVEAYSGQGRPSRDF
jgi:hypothetical protein